MFKKIFVVFLSSTIIFTPLLAQTKGKAKGTAKPDPVEQVSTAPAVAAETPAPQAVILSTAVAALEDEGRVLNEAISSLNYKIEYLTSRNTQLNKDMDDLRETIKEQKSSIEELNTKQPQDEKLSEIETELSLVRTDLAQLKEDVGVVQSTEDKPKAEVQKEWYQADWVAPAGLGISVLALLVAVLRK